MTKRALVLGGIITTTLLVCTPAALASPRHTDTDRHQPLTSWADHDRVRERPTDHVWDRYNSRDDDDSDWSDDDSDSSDESSDDNTDSGTSDTGTDTTTPMTDGGTSLGGTLSTGTARTITASLSGYSFQDNTPAGSAIISMPVIHGKAGGTGTFADPITTAVPGSSSSPETPKGTRIYVARLKRYFVVEDSGATKEGVTHFDLYVGGEGFSKSASDKCMNSYTAKLPVVINPAAGLPVTVGPLTGANGCVI